MDECRITRQAFYYHFSDIPDLLRWTLCQSEDQVLSAYRDLSDAQGRIRYLLLMAINAKPYVQKGMQSNYGAEIEQILSDRLMDMFARIAGEEGFGRQFSEFERRLMLRYHTQAVIGLLREWTDQDTADLDAIVGAVYHIIKSQLPV